MMLRQSAVHTTQSMENERDEKKIGWLSKEFHVSTFDTASKMRVLDLLDDEIKSRDDICYFSEHLLGIPLNAFQKRWLTMTTTPRSEWKEKFDIDIEDIGGFMFGSNISSIGNQGGKTVAIAIKHIQKKLTLMGR